MHKKVSQLKVGILLSYISRMIQIIVGLIYTPIMIRLLGQSEYGVYNIAASTIAYLGVLNFGFGSAYMRFYSRYRVKEESENIAILNGMFITIYSILGLIVVMAGIILTLNVEVIFGESLSNQELIIARLLLIILIVNLAISFPIIVFNNYVQANEKFVFQNLIQIIRQISTPMINLPILLAGHGSVGMVIGTVIINIIMEIFIVMYCIKKLKFKFSMRNLDSSLLKEMTVYSSYIFINMIVDQVNNNMDKTLLGRYQGTVSVAIYSVGASFREYYQQLSTTIAAVFTPRIHRLVANNTDDFELTRLFTRVGRIQFSLLCLVMLGFIFFGGPFVGMWAGEGYYDSYKIALILMIPLSIPLIQTIGIEVQRAKNMHQFRSWAYFFMAIGNIIVSVPLAQTFGGIGAAYGTAISLIIGNGIAMNWYNHTKIGLDMIYFWNEIAKFIPALVAPLIYGILVNYFINLYSIRNLLIHGSLFVIIYLISMWFIGLNKYEKSLLSNPFK